LTNGYQWVSVDEVLQTFNKKGLTWRRDYGIIVVWLIIEEG
jgi:hypothetical protein